jgi:hypothetical protein
MPWVRKLAADPWTKLLMGLSESRMYRLGIEFAELFQCQDIDESLLMKQVLAYGPVVLKCVGYLPMAKPVMQLVNWGSVAIWSLAKRPIASQSSHWIVTSVY